MSPERILGEQYNSKSDIWSFGIILYELATGRHPYKKSYSFVELHDLVTNTESPKLPDDGSFSLEL